MRELTSADVLARLAVNPRSEFLVKSLAPGHLDLLRPFASFQPEPRLGESIACPTRSGSGCMRVLDEVAGELLAICPCDAHEAPLAADASDLVRFTIDPSRLADALARTFELAERTSALSERCWYLGMTTIDDQRFALVLSLFDDRDAMRELRALPGALPVSVDEVVCLTPTFEPSPDETLALSAIHVSVARVDTFDTKVSLRELLRPARRTVPLVTLTTEQQAEARAATFRCSWPIVVTGQVAKGGTNVVEIAGAECRLGRAAFPLFMRLLTGLFESENGYLPVGRLRGGGGLAGEGYYKSESTYQAHDQLRGALGDEYEELVEVGGGMIRLSVHRGYVRVDCEVLAQHRDARVRQLAARIAAGLRSDQARSAGEERAPDAYEP